MCAQLWEKMPWWLECGAGAVQRCDPLSAGTLSCEDAQCNFPPVAEMLAHKNQEKYIQEKF